jgi:hypothetical protein
MAPTQAQKFAFIKWAVGKEDADLTAFERARQRIGISRTYASKLNNGVEALKRDAAKLDEVFAKFAPEPGDAAYRSMHAEVRRQLEARTKEAIKHLDRYVVPAAYGNWACVALDKEKPVVERLRKGNTAQRALFDWCNKLERERKQHLEEGTINEPDVELAKRGRAVIDTLVELIGHHREPPEGLFENASPAARASGYRMFRTRLFNDQLGWHGCALDYDAEARAELYTRGYKSGLPEDLMWLHEIWPDVAHPNNAWNLAMHAGEWSESVRFADVLMRGYPHLLYDTVMGLPPICEDKTVWPGVAAIVVDARYHGLDRFRAELKQERYSEMMTVVRKMTRGINNKLSYVEVLAMEKDK